MLSLRPVQVSYGGAILSRWADSVQWSTGHVIRELPSVPSSTVGSRRDSRVEMSFYKIAGNGEVVDCITANLDRISDIYALTLTSRKIYDDASRRLYRELDVDNYKTSHIRMLHRVAYSPKLAASVRSLSAGRIKGDDHDSWWNKQIFQSAFQRLVFRAIGAMPGLKKVKMDFRLLQTLTNGWSNCYDTPTQNPITAMPLNAPHTLRDLSVEGLGSVSLYNLLCSSSLLSQLTHLSIPEPLRESDLEDVFEPFEMH